MRKILYLFLGFVFLCIVGCNNPVKHISKSEGSKDTVGYDTVYIDEFIRDYIISDTFNPADAAKFDSMNAAGGALHIRCAERFLDTIVNHYHIIFIPEV